ncbi:cardiolipin synthetase [Diaporthe amygdali]|uniref:cardiolipin synthetase n=1 Tax=Phomopsis amygdali TaxID=1214568 RepID=UPI0022FEB501|nr:cardiolipin synthetase [Diaporthe amygdali]KAJ0116540.1 cardiolipin synthetase [Diaporthe amygdali]
MSLRITCQSALLAGQGLHPSRCLRLPNTSPWHALAAMSGPAAALRCPNKYSPTRVVSDASPSSTALGITQLRTFVSLTRPRRKREEREPGLPSSSASQPSKIANAIKKALPVAAHENIYTIPNLLTASRLVLAPVIGYCILHDHHAWTLGLFAYAGITDLLDGWIARKWNQGTVVGTVIDPMADKTLMTVLTVALAMKGGLPIWLAVIILGRDVALAISAIYFRWISLPPPKTFMRYWDFSLPSAEVHPTTISKYNTFLQLALMGLTTMAPLVPVVGGTPLTVMQYVVATTTVWSGASYVYSKDAVKILSHEEIKERQKGDQRP